MTISAKQIKKVTKDYHSYFPDWVIIDKNTMVRENGPVLQGIVFDLSSRDIYRPTGFIRILTAPKTKGAMELAQRLRYPNGAPDRSVKYKNHLNEIDEIVQELHSQIIPSIDQPLEVSAVLDAMLSRVTPTGPMAYSLASLYMYLEHDTQAMVWVDRYQVYLEERGEFISDTDIKREQFLVTALSWLNEGTEKTHFEKIIQSERRKIGVE